MNTLLIIDGLNLVRRLHAAMGTQPDMDALTIRVTSACQKLIRFHQPSHVTIVWDGDQESWRKQLYPDYKKGRKPMPEDLAKALPALKTQLEKEGVYSINADSEADDVIATLASKIVNHQGKAIIVSTDKGFAQLLHPQIVQWDHFNQAFIDMEALERKLGVDRAQLLDFIALSGDSGNKIPGIPGIGPKSASELLKAFRTLKNVYNSLEMLGAKQAKKLDEGKEMARMSYKLGKLRTDMPLKVNLSQLRVSQPKA
ncbi:flap endonuclease Xni [Shewanella corallii]|uniref:Flap endonuclease Xni n=1 Tax=Shewanella corallii TaxID=560080 RepID=A0ABT0NC85_9GAMM|nr:flap endonuclease Xni [Shewanella corallii]MCL2915397.1 flap endonuclease Xni [Shewanella corallii]